MIANKIYLFVVGIIFNVGYVIDTCSQFCMGNLLNAGKIFSNAFISDIHSAVIVVA